MVERIQRIIQIKKLTSSKFADQVGVPRSTISHILSGRNNPSLEFLMKILDAFPDINTSWLVRGEGPMQTISNSLFRDEDFLPEDSQSSKPNKKNVEGSQTKEKNTQDLSKEVTENQFSQPTNHSIIPPHTSNIPESPSLESIKSPSSDDTIEGNNSNNRDIVDIGVNPEDKNPEVAKTMAADKKLSANKKAEKIIIIYHDGTFSEHVPSG